MEIHTLGPERAGEVARVLRAAFDERLPWLAGRHTPEEDLGFVRDHLFRVCRVHGAVEDGRLLGVLAHREGWIDQLYVLPQAQGRGLGGALVGVAKAAWPELQLWTFQRNTGARRFYERHGFVAREATDGRRNDEQEPDVRYQWTSGWPA